MATITPISILNRIGEPGAPTFLSPAELAYNQPDPSPPAEITDVLYIGNGVGVSVLVGSARQLELWGDQTILPGSAKTINVGDLKLIGGQANWLLQTDGNGNLSFTNAPGGGLTEVATDATLSGLGTTTSPLGVVPHAVAVAADGVTISGNGTSASPLAVIGHTVSVATDGITITGNGTAANPLLVPPDSVAIASDGLTITGNGTSASPLRAMTGAVAVITDGVTIAGTGVTASPLHVLPNSVAVAVSAPLTGNGTTATPLGLSTPLALQYGGTGINASSNADLLTQLGAASAASLAGYLPLTGGTLTGALTLAGNATANLQPVSLQQMNSAIAAIPPSGVTSVTAGTGLTGGTITTTGTISLTVPVPVISGGTGLTSVAAFNVVAGNGAGALSVIAPGANGTILGSNGTTALPSFLTLTSLLDVLVGTGAQGQVLYRGSTAWTALAPGTAGQVLQSGGASANPSWASAGAGVTSFNTRTGAVTLALADVTGVGGAPIASPTFTGTVTLPGNAAANLQAVPLQQLNSTVGNYLPLAGGTLSGALTANGGISTTSISASGSLSATSNVYGYNFQANGTGVLFSGIGGNNNMGFYWNGGNGQIGCTVDGGFVGAIQFIGSDVRLKSNIAPVSVDPLGVVNQIVLRQFDMRIPGPDTVESHWDVGFLADQLAPLVANAVAPGDGEKTFDTVNLMPLVAYLVGAVQQLSAEIAALKP